MPRSRRSKEEIDERREDFIAWSMGINTLCTTTARFCIQAISKMIDTSYASVHEDLGSLCSGARYCGHLIAANASSMSEIPLWACLLSEILHTDFRENPFERLYETLNIPNRRPYGLAKRGNKDP